MKLGMIRVLPIVGVRPSMPAASTPANPAR